MGGRKGGAGLTQIRRKLKRHTGKERKTAGMDKQLPPMKKKKMYVEGKVV